jgi:hypothetical protein
MTFNIGTSLKHRRDLAFSLDCLFVGIYFWFGDFTFRFGGYECKENYCYVVPTYVGFGVVLIPFAIYWHTPFKLFNRVIVDQAVGEN